MMETMSEGIVEKAEERWEHAGLECCVCASPTTGKCGYVRLPDPFRTRKLYYDDISYDEVEVHGGLTYGMDEGGWVGFDTAHLGDVWLPEHPGDESPMQKTMREAGLDRPEPISPYTRVWDAERLRLEVNSLAAQLAKWCEAHPDFEGEMTPAERHAESRRKLREWADRRAAGGDDAL